jgi:hypothetical protein
VTFKEALSNDFMTAIELIVSLKMDVIAAVFCAAVRSGSA